MALVTIFSCTAPYVLFPPIFVKNLTKMSPPKCFKFSCFRRSQCNFSILTEMSNEFLPWGVGRFFFAAAIVFRSHRLWTRSLTDWKFEVNEKKSNFENAAPLARWVVEERVCLKTVDAHDLVVRTHTVQLFQSVHITSHQCKNTGCNASHAFFQIPVRNNKQLLLITSRMTLSN